MCLYTAAKEGQMSKEPRSCYRFYERGSKGEMISPFMRTSYRLKEGDEVVAEGIDVSDEVFGQSRVLGEGYIHAFGKKFMILLTSFGEVWDKVMSVVGCFVESSLKELDYEELDEALNEVLNRLGKLVLCEMEIPAGERYWVGINKDICARRMIFRKEIILKKSEILRLLSDRPLICGENVMEAIRMCEDKGE